MTLSARAALVTEYLLYYSTLPRRSAWILTGSPYCLLYLVHTIAVPYSPSLAIIIRNGLDTAAKTLVRLVALLLFC